MMRRGKGAGVKGLNNQSPISAKKGSSESGSCDRDMPVAPSFLKMQLPAVQSLLADSPSHKSVDTKSYS